MSKRALLRRLVKHQPTWSYRQYAEHLGWSTDSVRGALSAMGLSRNQRQAKLLKEKTQAPEPKPEAKIQPVVRAASKAGPTRSGYTRIL